MRLKSAVKNTTWFQLLRWTLSASPRVYPPFALVTIRSWLPGPCFFLHKGTCPCAYIRSLRWLLYPRGFRTLGFAQGRLPMCLYPPFALAAIPSWLPGPWFWHKGACPYAYIRPLRWLLYARGFRALGFWHKGACPCAYIRPFQGRGTVAPAQWWWVRRRFSFGAVSFFLFYRSLKFWTVIFCSFTSWRIS